MPLHDAQQRLLDLVQDTATETVPCETALGRYLAKPLCARRTQPAADLSAMDGFAVAGPGPWEIIGESRCGAPFSGTVKTDQATRVSTGAHMPDGSDRIVLVEDSKLSSASILTAIEPPVPHRHIRLAGADFEAGAELLNAGTKIGPGQIALARMAGHSALETHTAPQVTILECGDELATDPTNCAAYQIPASNGAMLAALASVEACTIAIPQPAADDLAALVAAINQHSESDLLVISGGASVGDHDLVRPALEKLGANIDFWRVAMKPGKPIMVARRGRQIILGLPGNPVSSFVTSYLFMLPALRKMLGASQCLPVPIPLKSTRPIAAGSARRTFLRARFESGEVTPLDQQGSGATLALAQANVLIERPENCHETKAGTYVPVYILGNGGIA